MEQRLAEFGVPVVIGLPVGHDPANEPWVYGRTGDLDLGPALVQGEQVALPRHAEDAAESARVTALRAGAGAVTCSG